MKKFLLPFLMIFMLSSCGMAVPKSECPDFTVNSAVSIDYMQSRFTADVKTAEDGKMTMTIKTPENLSGITVQCSADEMSVHYGTLKLECTNGYLPFTQLYKIISFAKNSEPSSAEAGENENTYEYTNDGEKYIFITDSKTNRIKKLETSVSLYEMG